MNRSVLLFVLCTNVLMAQRFRGGEGWRPEVETCRTAREVPTHSNTETPVWKNRPGLERDAFTFVRIRYDRSSSGSWSAGSWYTDFPDSDLNLSFRLQQVTSMKVDPDGRVLRITDKELFDYPWIYMVEPGRLQLRDEEVSILREYLLNGGFLMADDFWGERQWANFEQEMKRVFPDRDFTELPMEHPIFHGVFDLNVPKNGLQIPNYRLGVRSEYSHVTWEYHDGEECREVHYRAIMDDRDRLMVIACHNTDDGDGWEREGESDYFFHEFSEKRAYPLAMNILYYAMTH
jgi:hypothetical protein